MRRVVPEVLHRQGRDRDHDRRRCARGQERLCLQGGMKETGESSPSNRSGRDRRDAYGAAEHDAVYSAAAPWQQPAFCSAGTQRPTALTWPSAP
jgi:hypothetical protein